MALNVRQQRFVDGRVGGKTQPEAYRAAGFRCSNASLASAASALEGKLEVSQEIARRLAKVQERTGITAERILTELMRLATADVSQAYDTEGNLRPLSEIPEDVRRCIASIDVEMRAPGLRLDTNGSVTAPEAATVVKKVRFWSKDRSLEMLGKHLKLFTEKHELTGKDGAPIQYQVITGVPVPGDTDPSAAPLGEA